MKKRPLHIIKAAVAAALFAAPCVLYYVILRSRIPGDAILYSADIPWLLSPIAGISAYLAMKGRKGGEVLQEETDEADIYDAGVYTEPANGENEAVSDEGFADEYPELYARGEDGEAAEKAEQNETRIEPCRTDDISTAISAQKSDAADGAEICELDESEDEYDKAWRDFLAEGANEKESFDSSIYEDLPDTLPEGFESPDDNDGDDEEKEDENGEEEQLGEAAEHRSDRTLILRIAAAVLCAAAVGSGVLMSYSYVSETRDGITVGSLFKKQQYSWADASEVIVSPSAWGDGIKAELIMNDGKRVTVCSDSMITGAEGELFSENNIEIYAYIVSLAKDGGAAVSVNDEKTIISAYSASDDWEYIRQIIEN